MTDKSARYRPTRTQNEQYLSLAHAIQSGVSSKHGLGSDDGSPKHLRVGIALLRAELSALRTLLIDAGVVSNDAFWDSILAEMRNEVAAYEADLTNRLGKPVHLA